jgi:hypothetical protein
MLRETVHAEARRRGGWEMVHDAPQALLQGCGAEIYEETDLQIGEAEIREELFAMHRSKFLDGLDLDDDAILDKEIHTECIREEDAVILEAEDLLPFDFESASSEHAREDSFVNRLQESRSEGSMHLNRRIDDRAGNLV